MDWDQRECACIDKSAKGLTGRQQELSGYGRRWQFHSARATPLGDPPFFLPLHPLLSLPFLSSAVCWLLCSIAIGAGSKSTQTQTTQPPRHPGRSAYRCVWMRMYAYSITTPHLRIIIFLHYRNHLPAGLKIEIYQHDRRDIKMPNPSGIQLWMYREYFWIHQCLQWPSWQSMQPVGCRLEYCFIVVQR